jgi:hypothetical protein
MPVLFTVPNPNERDKCLSQIVFLQKNKKTICKALMPLPKISPSFPAVFLNGALQSTFKEAPYKNGAISPFPWRNISG